MIELVPHNQIKPSPLNPRKRVDADQLDELAESILQEGLLQNLVVRPVGTKKQPAYEVAAGERRWRAIGSLIEAKQLPDDHQLHAGVPVTIRELTDLQLLQIATTENLARADMTPMEEARAFQHMLELGSDVETVAAETGFSMATVRKRLALVERLSPKVMKLLEDGKLSLAQAQAYTTAPVSAQERCLEAYAGNGPAFEIRRFLAQQRIPVSRAKFDLGQYTGSFTQPGIFEQEGGAEDCFDDTEQFHRLQRDWVDAYVDDAKSTWAWVEVKEWVYSSDYDKATKGDKKKDLGVIVQFDPRSGEVKLHERLKQKQRTRTRAETSEGPGDPLVMTNRHTETIQQHRTHALQMAMATGDVRAALATFCTQILSRYWWGATSLRTDQRQPGWDSPEVKQLLADLAAEIHPALTEGVGGYSNSHGHGEVLRTLVELPLDRLLRVFQVLMALQVAAGGSSTSTPTAAGVHSGMHELFEVLDVRLPTFRDLGADYLLLSSKPRLASVAEQLLDSVAAAEVKGKPRKQVAGRILASAGSALDQVPPELQMPAPKPVKASAEVVDDAA